PLSVQPTAYSASLRRSASAISWQQPQLIIPAVANPALDHRLARRAQRRQAALLAEFFRPVDLCRRLHHDEEREDGDDGHGQPGVSLPEEGVGKQDEVDELAERG